MLNFCVSRLTEEVQDETMDLMCKLLDDTKADGTSGHHSLIQRIEEFSFTLLTGLSCPSPIQGAL
jgi:hypothetical protein